MDNDHVAPVVARERERKFDLDAGQPVPTLNDTGPVVTQGEPDRTVLDAVYFDTADHRLLRSGITLRRRTGGADAGWHLKLPAGSGERDEIRLPLDAGDTTVPQELAERVQDRINGHDLVEVAHLRTERYSYGLVNRAGRRIAVLADDHVTAEVAGPTAHLDGWRELEVELEPGTDPRLLDTVSDELMRTGARPAHWPSKLSRLLADVLPRQDDIGKRATAGEVVMAYLRKQVDAVRRHDLGVRRDADDSVHQLRVAMRRLRSGLSNFRRVLDREHTTALSEELKWAATVLSDARDTQVLRAWFEDELSTLGEDSDLRTARLALTRHFDQTAADARAAILDMLNGPRYAALLGSLEDLIADPPLTERAGEPAQTELRHALARAHRRLTKAADALDDTQDTHEVDAGLHETRKKAKQARYTADAAKATFGKRVGRWRKTAKAIQGTLGDHHDLVEARALLQRLRQNDITPETAFVFGSLHERARARGTTLHLRFNQHWEKLGEPT
ncbi:CYTH and CHAD domain-containing protein [Amycolatopsis pithecellobii]|uniref:CHAD domain-containing protein n=1 Tax=Amycolatopsis pithecellobii TaxID=664692 RepID=A0A6N7YWW3_9PSEU|nr:CYTH and CHAD domain-containing protein [Amycolatopsis pithecellobii]MTD56422.1 CHAD domain-containing protein [Amycolatopsis pithecellobii]